MSILKPNSTIEQFLVNTLKKSYETPTMALVLFTAILLGYGTGFEATAHAQALIKIDGSSTVFPITEGVSEEFQNESKGSIRVTVGVSGTGGGFKKFCRGETDIQNASRPITKEEMDACSASKVKYFEIPIAYDAIAIVVNPKNDWVNEVSIKDLKTMWEPAAQGKILKWNQINPKWPKEKLELFGASTDNGTFDYFTEAIVEKAKSSRGDYTSSVDHNTRVAGVSGNKYALGYMPYAYYISNSSKLKLLGIFGGPKAPKQGAIQPSEKTVIDGTYYPLARPIFIYVSRAALLRPEVKKYIDFYIKQAPAIVKQVQYIPLPTAAYQTVQEHLKKDKFGTAFKGQGQVGLTIDQILKLEKL